MQVKQFMEMGEQKLFDIIEEKAQSYTPEWKFDRENPDPGSAIAAAYAAMTERTLRQFRYFPEKNRICFFNQLGAELRPASPAEGYIRFFLSGDQDEGQQITRNTMLYAEGEDEEIPFKVKNDVFVTPARIQSVYETCDKYDYISCLYGNEEETEEEPENLPLFWERGENLQEHTFVLGHSSLLRMASDGVLELSFLLHEGCSISEEMLCRMADRKQMEISYSNGEYGFVPFQEMEVQEGKLRLFHRQDMPPVEKVVCGEYDRGQEQYYLKFQGKDMAAFSDFFMKDALISMQASYIRPESIQCNEEECSQIEYFPFGERMGMYHAVYFASTEALEKKGAVVRLSFHMDFEKIPITDDEPEEKEWKWVMKSSQMKPDKEYDIMLTEVVWEYYNGRGWARLFPGKEYADIFYAGDAAYGQNHTIEFLCPPDMQPVTIQSCESCYIRARAVRLTNLYKTRGYYISPVLSDTYFHYDYGEAMQQPEHLYIKNNLEMQHFSRQEWNLQNGIRPFLQMEDPHKTVYFGFTCMPQGDPIRIFFEPETVQRRQQKELSWEYYSEKGWQDLNAADETENLSRMGMLIFLSQPDFRRHRLFCEEAFWIRCIDKKDSYLFNKKGVLSPPSIKHLFLNVTDAVNVSDVKTEYFHMDVYQKVPVCNLQEKKVLEIQVWVDESDSVTEAELLELKQNGQADIVSLENGQQQAWVLWEQAETFAGADARARIYRLDRNEGTVSFGNGRQGKIPSAADGENIRIVYRTGGGSHANLPAGAVNRMDQVYGYVSRVENPMPMAGGSDRESTEHAIKRLSSAIRHQNRAVTSYDYECLAMQACEGIAKVTCFAGRTESGESKNGTMTLVLCPEDYRHARNQFSEMKERIRRYMLGKISLPLLSGERFFLRMPVFAEVSVRMRVITDDYREAFRIRKEILEVLEQFLDPLSGNFDRKGYEIGTLPNHMQIRNAVNLVEGILAIRELFVTISSDGEEIEFTGNPKADFMLPVSGNHEISIQVEQKRA